MTTQAQEQPKELSGAQILIEALHAEGVKHVFGYPGGSVLPIYDEIYQRAKFRHILVRHEQAAVHAADAYARSSGEVGVVLVTSGPGATNAVTGIATAYADSIPLVVLTGQVGTSMIGTDAFQECDTVGITRPCVKHNYLVKDVRDLADTVKEAFYIARSGRPGPVLIDLPKDVQTAKCPFIYTDEIDIPGYRPVTKGHPGQVKRALQCLAGAARPLVYIGGGVVHSGASELLADVVREIHAPVVSTLMALGCFDADDENFLGMVGMHGTYEANMAMQECDVLFAVGARFDDRVIGNPADFAGRPRTVIQIDVDPSSISKRVPADVPIVGDVTEVLSLFVEQIRAGAVVHNTDKSAWKKKIEQWKSKKSLAYKLDPKGAIKPQAVIERVGTYTKNAAYYTTDVGEHQMWAAQYLRLHEPRHWMTSGGLGTMGYGIPAALGACVAHPDKPVVCFTGDGSVQMCIQELATAKQYGLHPKIFLLNNGYLGMVALWQRSYYNGHLSESVMDVQPDFVKLAECYGHVGIRVKTYAELDKAIEECFTKYADELVFVDVVIGGEEPVLPMVGPGLGLTQMVLAEEN